MLLAGCASPVTRPTFQHYSEGIGPGAPPQAQPIWTGRYADGSGSWMDVGHAVDTCAVVSGLGDTVPFRLYAHGQFLTGHSPDLTDWVTALFDTTRHAFWVELEQPDGAFTNRLLRRQP